MNAFSEFNNYMPQEVYLKISKNAKNISRSLRNVTRKHEIKKDNIVGLADRYFTITELSSHNNIEEITY